MNIRPRKGRGRPRRAPVDEKATLAPHTPALLEEPQVQLEFQFPLMPPSATVAQT